MRMSAADVWKPAGRNVHSSMSRSVVSITKWVGAVVPLPESYQSERLRAAAGVTYLGDDSKAREELGFAPRSLEDGLPDAARAILEEMIEGDPS